MNLSALISGILFFAVGAFAIFLGVFEVGEFIVSAVIVFQGLVALILGIYIIFNRNKEDNIEQIKSR